MVDLVFVDGEVICDGVAASGSGSGCSFTAFWVFRFKVTRLLKCQLP